MARWYERWEACNRSYDGFTRRLLYAFALLVWTSDASAAGICTMSVDEAVSSPECVRWYFAYNGKTLGTPDPRFASMPYKDRMRLVAKALFALAEQNCASFD